jgi:hypothetical protein
MSIGKMSPTGAVSFIKDNINWASLQAQCSGGLVDALDFFDIRKYQVPINDSSLTP